MGRRRREQIAAAPARRSAEDVAAASRTGAEKRAAGARWTARAVGAVGGRRRASREEIATGRRRADVVAGDQASELGDRRELHPVGEPFLPGVGVPLDVAALD